MRRAILLLALISLLPGAASGRTWSLSGEELRARHPDTLEDILRLVPFLRVDRFGAAGLPFRCSAGPFGSGELLLIVDGIPMRDPWTGENLYETVPVALLERVELRLLPGGVDYGGAALAGVIFVETRQPDEPKVQTRIHLTRAVLGERGRQLSFETPPGEVGLSLGLDEFFTNSYLFSRVYGGPEGVSPASPEVSYSRRRVLTTRLHLDAGVAGPLELRMVQSGSHMDLTAFGLRNSYRDLFQVSLALPRAPWGKWRLRQSVLERRALGWESRDASLWGEWRSPGRPLGSGALTGIAGGEWHELGLLELGLPLLPDQAKRTWFALNWRGEPRGDVALAAGLRWELRAGGRRRLIYQGELGWSRAESPFGLRLFGAGGDPEVPWRQESLADYSLWPETISSPAEAFSHQGAHRSGASIDWTVERFWSRLLLIRHDAGSQWSLAPNGGGGYRWRQSSASARSAAGLSLGSFWQGRHGDMAGEFSISRDIGDEQAAAAASGFEDAGYPQQLALGLTLSRPFFRSDARLRLRGRLEQRSGHPLRGTIWRVELEAELSVLDARFWARLPNATNWSGQEIAGFPIPERGFHFGLDWHLDH